MVTVEVFEGETELITKRAFHLLAEATAWIEGMGRGAFHYVIRFD